MGSDVTRILMFHRILADQPAAFGLPDSYRLRGTALTSAEFARALDEAGQVVPLEAVEDALAIGCEPPPGAVLTFDDGYREHLEVVVPMLAERGLTATFYVATGLQGAGAAVAAVDAWYWLLDHAENGVATVPLQDGSVFRGRLDSVNVKAAWVGGPPKAALLAASSEHRNKMLEALAEHARCELPSDLAGRLYLRHDEWGTLVRCGMRVGAHSVGHPRLTQVSDAELDLEVGESVALIAGACTPVAFAYPDGAFDDRVVERVRREGVTSAVTCEAGIVNAGTDMMRLPRAFIASSVAGYLR